MIGNPQRHPVESSLITDAASQATGRAVHRSTTGALLIPSTPSRHSGHNTPKTPTSQEYSSLGHSRNQSIDERTSISSLSCAPPPSYWCPVCKDHLPFSTRDGWKRHMKEHETFYPCLQCGPATNLGKDRKFSRRSNLVIHLRDSHGVPEGGTFADQWKCTESKKAYACGLCITTFRTIVEQLNHIDHKHFKHSQDVTEWNHNNYILGLLSQPDVKIAWRKLLASRNQSNSGCSWPHAVACEIQAMLEMHQDSPDALAREAFNRMEHHDNATGQIYSISTIVPVSHKMASDQPLPTARPQLYTAQESNDRTSSYYATGMEPSVHSDSANKFLSTQQGMMIGQGNSGTHYSSLALNVDPMLGSQTTATYQPDGTQQFGPMQGYHDDPFTQQFSTSANVSDAPIIPFSLSRHQQSNHPIAPSLQATNALPSNLQGIGSWQGPDIRNNPVTVPAGQLPNYQPNYQQALYSGVPSDFTFTDTPYNPQDGSDHRSGRFSTSGPAMHEPHIER